MSITWNGVSSDTIGVIVERIPNRYVPTRRFSPQQVAGRNGNILLVDKSFPNVEQEYDVYLSAEAQGLPSVARACDEWLMGPDGYCRLQDSYDTTVYREAFLMGGYDLENILNKFGRCTITFSCKPQKYLLTGDTPISIPAGSTTTYTGSVVQFDGITSASITSLSTTITPKQSGSGDPSPTNVRPISGITGLSVYRTKKNLLGYVPKFISSVPPYDASRVVWLQSGTTYTFSFDGITGATSWRTGVRLYDVFGQVLYTGSDITSGRWSGNSSGKYYINGSNNTYTDVTFTANVDCYATFVFLLGDTSASSTMTNPQLELGSTATPYEPYDGNTYSVDWSAQAGTVYGGTVDVVTGLLTVDRVSVNLNPAAKSESANGYYWYTTATALSIGAISGLNAGLISNRLVALSNITDTTSEGKIAFFANGIIRWKEQGSLSLDDYRTYLASNPLQIVYELANPLTYQLSAQEIGVLVGENNVWTSSGPVTATVTTPLGGIVTNPTPFEARPMLKVSGLGEITINGKSIQILEAVSDFLIDCETMEAEDNSKIYCMDFPELSGGENEIVGDGSITALTVTPRWWTL